MIVVAMKPMPITMISAALRSQDHGNPGRRAKGISHAELSAFCSEFATPSAPMKIPITATASAIPVWLRWPMLALELRADHRVLVQRGLQHLLLLARDCS